MEGMNLTLQLLPTALQLVQPFPGSFRFSPQISQLFPAGLPLPAHSSCISLLVQPCLHLLLQLLVQVICVLKGILLDLPCSLLKQLQGPQGC